MREAVHGLRDAAEAAQQRAHLGVLLCRALQEAGWRAEVSGLGGSPRW